MLANSSSYSLEDVYVYTGEYLCSCRDLQAVFELLLPGCGSQVWTDMPELPPMCEEDAPSERKSATEAMLLLNGGWPAKVTWSPLPPQS